MALEIKMIPTLTGEEAERFLRAAEEAEQRVKNAPEKRKKYCHEQMRKILRKSKMM